MPDWMDQLYAVLLLGMLAWNIVDKIKNPSKERHDALAKRVSDIEQKQRVNDNKIGDIVLTIQQLQQFRSSDQESLNKKFDDISDCLFTLVRMFRVQNVANLNSETDQVKAEAIKASDKILQEYLDKKGLKF